MKLIFRPLSHLILCSIVLVSCSKKDELKENNNGSPVNLSSFTITVKERAFNRAIIEWTASVSNISTDIVKYKVVVNGVTIHTNLPGLTDTLQNILPQSAYSGKVIAFTNNGDSAAALFTLPKLTNTGSESIKAIIVVYGENTSAPAFAALAVYNPDRTLRWKKTFANSFGFGYCAYDKGLVYFDHINVLPNFSSLDTLDALDIETGNIVWRLPHTGEILSTPVFRNDTLYHITNINGSNSLVARNSRNGTEYWRQTLSMSQYPTQLFEIDGNIIAARSMNPGTVFYVDAIDLSSRVNKWSHAIGINSGSELPKVRIANNSFYVGTPSGNLLSLNEMNGAVQWTKNNELYTQPVLSGDKLYAMASNKLYAFNALTGSEIWQNNCGTGSIYGDPWVTDQLVYQFCHNGIGPNLSVFGGATGGVLFQKNDMDYYRYNVIADNKLFATKNTTLSNDPVRKIIIFDVNTANKIDSIVLPQANSIYEIQAGIVTSADVLRYPN